MSEVRLQTRDGIEIRITAVNRPGGREISLRRWKGTGKKSWPTKGWLSFPAEITGSLVEALLILQAAESKRADRKGVSTRLLGAICEQPRRTKEILKLGKSLGLARRTVIYWLKKFAQTGLLDRKAGKGKEVWYEAPAQKEPS